MPEITIISEEGPGDIKTFDDALARIKLLEGKIGSLEHHILEINGGFMEYLGMPCTSLRQRLSQIIRRATAQL